MILCDVGVLLSAMIERSPHHETCRRHLEQLRRDDRPHALADLVLAAVVRIATNPKLFRPTPTPKDAFTFVEALRQHPRAATIAPGARHWKIFRDLVVEAGIRGPDTTDAYLAALAVESGCEWWTIDRGFSRFSGLRWRNLLDA